MAPDTLSSSAAAAGSAPDDPEVPDSVPVEEKGSRVVERHFPALDGLRGAAVLLVFFYHYGGGRHSPHPVLRGIGYLCSLGWVGVTLFFLLSGFLITGLLWGTKGQPRWFRNFYIRRALRILPLYYGTLLLILIWPLFDHSLRFREVALVVRIHALYLQNLPLYNWEWKQVPLPFGVEHYWTLAVEEQFYLLWPLLLFFVRNRRQGVLLCLGVFVFSTAFSLHNQMTAEHPAALWHSLQAHAGELALGGALALTFRTRWWTGVKRSVQVLGVLCGAVFLIGMMYLRAPGRDIFFANTYGLTAITVAFAGLLASMLEPGFFYRLATVRWLRWLGKISFGVYIFHLLLILWFSRLTTLITGHNDDDLFGLARILVGGSLTVLISWLSYTFYESRFLKLKDRLAPHRTRRPGLPPPPAAGDTCLSGNTEIRS